MSKYLKPLGCKHSNLIGQKEFKPLTEVQIYINALV